MNYIIITLLLISSLYADKVKKKTFACPTIEILKNAPTASADSLKLSMYAISNNCQVLSTKDKIEVIGYDSLKKASPFSQIIEKKTGSTLYVPSAAILVEQGGETNTFKF